jgi:hypothetical protein
MDGVIDSAEAGVSGLVASLRPAADCPFGTELGADMGEPTGNACIGTGWLGVSLGTSERDSCFSPGAEVLGGLHDAGIEPTIGVAEVATLWAAALLGAANVCKAGAGLCADTCVLSGSNASCKEPGSLTKLLGASFCDGCVPPSISVLGELQGEGMEAVAKCIVLATFGGLLSKGKRVTGVATS